MIEYKTADILKEDAEAIVNTVNCVGVMGRGIALQFRNAFPENFKAYVAACKREEVQPGRMFVYQMKRLTNPLYIINFPTKRHWREKSRIEDIRRGLAALIKVIQEYNITSIAIPPLGSGLGGLEWLKVKPLIEEAVKSLNNVHVIIHEPQGTPQRNIIINRKVPKMTAGRAALIELIHRYLKGLLDPFLTLLEAHKLMYFMQAAGEPLKLQYVKAPYGPYAQNLRHIFNALEGHMISGYADGGDRPDKQLTLAPSAIVEAKAFLENHTETRYRFDKVVELVEGFESPFGLELLSTVHWVIKNEKASSPNEIVEKTYTWNPRKKQFTIRQINLAVSVLAQKGWVAKELIS